LKQQRMQQDLLFAREIQQSFLPRELPRAPGMELAAEYRPAFTVGGDFYDVFWLDAQRLCMCIGDVAGKGVSAALLMARLSSDLRLAMLSSGRPGRALEIVNRSMLERGQHDIFVTAVCLVLDVVEGGLLLANAGHVPPLLRRRDGYVEQVMGGAGTAIGFFEGEEFPQAHLVLEPGETMLFCTDGILEAVAPTQELWGIDRLGLSFAAAPASAEDVAARVLSELSGHVRDASQNDDLTLIVLGRVALP
jgi:serine phosphatase RsbU (regulator of sigma subunit)